MKSSAPVLLSYLALIAVAATSADVDALHAQSTTPSGKWTATVGQFMGKAGSGDLVVQPRGDKQSRAKLSMRNTKAESKFVWDIAVGRCGSEGAAIAPLATFAKIITYMDGGGQATADVPKLESGKLYYLRVFDPQTGASDANALGCANISESP